VVDTREGIITDRYLAPAITKLAINVGNQEGHEEERLGTSQRNLSPTPEMEQGLRQT